MVTICGAQESHIPLIVSSRLDPLCRNANCLSFPYPDAAHDLNRLLPLVKWLLAIPHYIVLVFLDIAVFVVVIIAWFA